MDNRQRIRDNISSLVGEEFLGEPLKKYWLSTFAALALLLLAGAQPAASDNARQKAVEKAIPTSQQAGEVVNAADRFAAYPGYNPDPCYRASSHDAADLCAQWRAALAAERSAAEARRATNWAIIATVLSSLGVAGLIVTVWQTFGALAEARRGNLLSMKANARTTRQAIASSLDTAKALEIAERNAKATELSVLESQKIGEAQTRAYLSAIEAKIYFASSGKIVIDCKVKNFGQSPAFKVKWIPEIQNFILADKSYRNLSIEKSFSDYEQDVASQTEQTLSLQYIDDLLNDKERQTII